ncbi:MAG: type II toxin-antitoxin system RelE/ParE family toxin [Reyranella sp.]|uniref:type II toxin-antitoxin system RelE/ParE family toxin n=1 Tax=Reyranella sp. TaxID=1929291 RepID=UPI0027316B5F|nr:type II toxin-antitoxin system RelE/ParE family toxin [Reyranella sp.]MDP1966653.1 type II toxin-antitoxin system RelE/ParE family toxin [Reyranella sp.]MDP2372972.1 type II toxin-antitoxin system RelE/ParE family toxin [Reyranella sp.]
MDLYFSLAAQLELDDAFAYLEREKTGLGYRFTADVDEALYRIQTHPLAWHSLDSNLRRCHLKHFRYGVIYRIRGDQAEIVAIAHDSRRLGYWRDRLDTK